MQDHPKNHECGTFAPTKRRCCKRFAIGFSREAEKPGSTYLRLREFP